ncbi:ABC transporter substrate-binding protein [Microvirga sp. W0021]|uniref:ABC transporter substrate-binding protein n=1 Tax=Hohaiivirga grylli TaxID=3133970 RepID=A0ABV0BJ63_9HYPH
MIKKVSTAIIATAMIFGVSSSAYAAEKLIIYTSMKESLIGKLKDGFVKKNPGIDVDYQSAGAGKLMAKLAAERESGSIQADVLWTSEVPDFYKMKDEGLFEKYISPEVASIINPLEDYDGSFTPARLGTLGIAYNTRFIKTAPVTWDDLKKKDYNGAYGIANPALSGTSYMSVALLVEKFGWEYFEDLKKNKAKMGKGSGQVVDDTASGELVASLAVDYITNDKIDKGATLALVYPPEMLVIPSPIALMKGSKNTEAAKKFIDYVLSKEGQTIIAGEGTLPVRNDVELPKTSLPSPEEAVKRAIKVDYPKLIQQKEETIKKFTSIMQGR